MGVSSATDESGREGTTTMFLPARDDTEAYFEEQVNPHE
jgi:hypothetical protein